ncbi:MAG: NAD(P)/FAD-dependent oxidoreductase [Candidatus Sulfobium sp.]|jgi:predicted Rossmann fold flavoprotein
MAVPYQACDSSAKHYRDVIVIGAGAAGLMCAAEAGARGRSVMVIDHAPVTGKKIRVSGGGRCNFGNLNTSPGNYQSENPGFCTSALARFGSQEFIGLLEKHGIRYHEEDGRLFCDNGSLEIVGMLEKECDSSDVEIRLNCRVSGIKKQDFFAVDTNLGRFRSHSLVVATGGVSFRQLGATGFGHRTARRFGLNVTPLRPALVPLQWGRRDRTTFGTLAGISFDTAVTCSGKTFRGSVLLTREGLSGPALLQASLYWREGTPLLLDLLPRGNAYEIFLSKRQRKVEMRNLLAGYLPKRFIQTWSDIFFASKPMNQYSDRELRKIALALHRWEIVPAGTAGFSRAEVTLGGIDTRELSSKTMEAKKVAGLYFVGEVMDVTGQLGGFNLQWAWSSGYAAGQFV